MNEDQAELIRIRAAALADAEKQLMAARKKYAKALRAWEACAQVKLDTEAGP